MRALLAAVLRRVISKGHLAVVDCDGHRDDFGEVFSAPIIMRLHDRGVAFDLLRNPQLTFGEAYMDGRLTIEGGSVGDFLDLITRNLGTGFGGGYMDWIARARYLVRRLMQRNGPMQSERNVAHHYDLSGALYELFLDTDKQYSCAYFEQPSDTLETA